MDFKILEGDSSRISLDVTPFHNGWCYYTKDDGGLYIDSLGENGKQNRRQINPARKTVDAVLPADGWVDHTQTLTISGLSAYTDGIIGVSQSLTEEQDEAAQNALLKITGQSGDTLTITAAGDLPACDIPVSLLLFG